jgi:glycolate oxidase
LSLSSFIRVRGEKEEALFREVKMAMSKKSLENLQKALAAIVGREWVTEEKSFLKVSPRTSEEVSKILKMANQKRTPVVPRGGGTGWWSKSVPQAGGILLDIRRMNDVLTIDEDTLTVTTQAGITFEKLEAKITEKGYRLVIFPESGRTATVAGHIETWGTSPFSSSGHEDQATQILSMKVVLPTGEIMHTGSGAVKTAGNFARRFFPSELNGLFIGAEGAFGVITEATLKMHKWPEAIVSRMIGFRELKDGVNTLRKIQERQRSGSLLTIVEQRLMKSAMLTLVVPRIKDRVTEDLKFILAIRGDGDAVDVRHHIEQTSEIARGEGGTVIEDEVPEWWKGRYHLISGAFRGPRIMLVAMVPMGKFLDAAALTEKFGRENNTDIMMLGYPMFGPVMLAHAVLPVEGSTPAARKKALALARKLMEELMNMGGVPHRVGTDFLPVITKKLDRSYYDFVKKLKKMLDPKGIMNPGLVVAGK